MQQRINHPHTNRRAETILIADDDVGVRDVTRDMLCHLGFHVTAIAGGEQAISWLQQHRVDLVILDTMLPGGRDHAETIRRLQQVAPMQRAIVLTDIAESERRQPGVNAYLRKPVGLAALASAVDSALGAPARGGDRLQYHARVGS